MKNLDEQEKDVTVRLIVPKEISSQEPSTKITLGAREEKNLFFLISNFSALVGAKYPIYALMEYDDNDKHYAVSSKSTVEIIEKKKLSSSYRFILIGIPVGLLLIYSLYIIIRKRKATKGAA